MDPFVDEPDEEEDEYEDWSPFPMKIYAGSNTKIIGGCQKIKLIKKVPNGKLRKQSRKRSNRT